MASNKSSALKTGDLVQVTIEKVAHGGHCIARHEGAVIFVRHAIPGENCRIQITSTGSSFNRADVVSVEKPSEFRVQAPCSFANRNGCGGCDFQHISIARQRALKSEVIKEQFERIAKTDISVEVEEVGEPLHWRTRVTATTDSNGALGFYSSRSHRVIPVKDCLIALPEIGIAAMSTQKLSPDVRIEIAYSSEGERMVAEAPKSGDGKFRQNTGPAVLHERVGEELLQVSQRSFWQGHKRAPEVLTEVVRNFAQLQEGEVVLDLYGGVGLFTSACLKDVGTSGSIHLIEGSKDATADAKNNFASQSNVEI